MSKFVSWWRFLNKLISLWDQVLFFSFKKLHVLRDTTIVLENIRSKLVSLVWKSSLIAFKANLTEVKFANTFFVINKEVWQNFASYIRCTIIKIKPEVTNVQTSSQQMTLPISYVKYSYINVTKLLLSYHQHANRWWTKVQYKVRVVGKLPDWFKLCNASREQLIFLLTS